MTKLYHHLSLDIVVTAANNSEKNSQVEQQRRKCQAHTFVGRRTAGPKVI